MGLLDRPTDCLCVCASKSNVKNNEDVLYNEESDVERPSRRLSLLQHHTPPSQGKKIESFIPLILSRVAFACWIFTKEEYTNPNWNQDVMFLRRNRVLLSLKEETGLIIMN